MNPHSKLVRSAGQDPDGVWCQFVAEPRHGRRPAGQPGTARLAFKTPPQDTTWDAMLAVWRAAVQPREHLRTFFAKCPISPHSPDPCHETQTRDAGAAPLPASRLSFAAGACLWPAEAEIAFGSCPND